MSSFEVTPPFPVFTGKDGEPLDNGFISVGIENLDPANNPVSVYWDEALTITAVQPIRTINGYPSRSGTPSNFFSGSAFSILVRDRNGVMVYSNPSVSDIRVDLASTGPGQGAVMVGFIQSGTGAAARTVESKLMDTVSVKDFGAVGDGAADDLAAIQAAVDSLTASVSIQDPSRYGLGGGTVVCSRGGRHKITGPIVLTHGVTLDLNGSTLEPTGNFDAIEIDYKYTELASKTTERVCVVNGAINGGGLAEAGITNRKPGGTTYAIENCTFENLHIYGCKVQMHIFGGWNNTFRNIWLRAADYNSTTDEGIFGFIGETMTAGGTYGPAGFPVTASSWGGGFNNNLFDTVIAVYLKRCGIHIRAISEAHAYSNKFINCNLEQIVKLSPTQAYAPYTDLTATPDGTDPVTAVPYTLQTLKWAGEPVGLHFLGRVAGHSVDNCYFEAIEDTGGITGGTGIILDDCGIMFAASVSKCISNAIDNNFFNSNVERVVHAARCIYTTISNSNLLLSTGARKGHLVEATAPYTTLINELTGNVNSSSSGFNYVACAGTSGFGSPKVRSTGVITVMSANPALDVYRDGSSANFSAIRFRDGSNAATNGQIGFNTSQLRLEGLSNIVAIINGNTRLNLNDTQFYSGTDNAMTCGTSGNRWSVVYAGTGTINTSDARTKQDFLPVSQKEKKAANTIKGMIKSFRFIDSVKEKGLSARTHFGVVAQEVAEAFRSEGLDPYRYALFCYDEWEDTYEDIWGDTGEKDEEGSPIMGVVGRRLTTPAGDRYGIRYEELLAFIISAM